MAISFLQYIQNYFTERKEMCRLLAKELTALSINVFNGSEIKTEMFELADKLIAVSTFALNVSKKSCSYLILVNFTERLGSPRD